MGKTISFVAREELAEWLQSRADAEMKTVSAVCQEIVAEAYRRDADTGTNSETSQRASEASDNLASSADEFDADDILDEHGEHWYEPDGENEYAVEPPERLSHKGRKYYKTKEGAAKRLLDWHGEE